MRKSKSSKLNKKLDKSYTKFDIGERNEKAHFTELRLANARIPLTKYILEKEQK
jgi:hypothetical protein